MILKEAFEVLISKRGWYKDSGVDRRLADRDKQNFLKGQSIPEERMRAYLRATGNWEQTQQEEWRIKYTPQPSSLHDSTK